MLGFILLDKPAGISSFDCIRKLRKLLQIRRMGHAGTLDPIATGLLIIAVGEATKLLPFLENEDKIYEVAIQLGATSDTYDREGAIHTVEVEVPPSLDRIQTVLEQSFTGPQSQTPPAFSAIHINGQRAYQAVRAGKAVQLPSRPVTFYSTEIVTYQWPLLTLRVHCSKGTYIRSLAHDLGQVLGCGGYIKELRRLVIGNANVDDAFSLVQIKEVLEKDRLPHHDAKLKGKEVIIPPEKFLTHIPHYNLNQEDYARLAQGGFLPYKSTRNKSSRREIISPYDNGPFLAIFQDRCVGILEVFQGRWLKFQRRFHTVEGV